MFNLRSQFLLDPSITFLNHGSFGATPKPVFDEYQRWQRELENQPVEFMGRRLTALMADARAALGAYLGTHADNLVYTQNVTISLNIAARSLELGAGDEVLTSDHEYGAMDRAWRFLSKERGFTYVHQPTSLESHTAFVESFWAGIITVIDGAHVAGQLPLHLDSLGADFYGGNLHKWLCAPKGAGFLYARPEMQRLLKPLVVSWGYESSAPSASQFVDHHEYWGTRDVSAFLTVPAAIRFQQENNWDKVRAACHELVKDAQARVCKLTGLPPIHSNDDDWFAQLAAAPLPEDTDIVALKSRLYDEYRVEIPLTTWGDKKLIRISIQGYNTEKDVDRLLEALSAVL